MTWTEIPTILDENTTDVLDGAGVDRTALAHLNLDTISVGDLAAWLYEHGAAHLSEIERIELAERLITRRRFITAVGGLLGAAALGACSAGEQAAAPTTTVAATRTVTHALGETEVPGVPQRIVVLDNMILDNILALGEKPLAYATSEYYDNDGFAAYLGDRIKGIQAIEGLQYEPDLETITVHNPDLIMGSVYVHEEIYDELSQIAPTVLLEAGQVDWKKDFMMVSEVLGKTEEAEQVLAEYEERVVTLRGALGDPQSINVSLISSQEERIRIFLPNSYVGQVLQDVGLSRPSAQRELDQENGFATEISLERLDLADGDVMFVWRQIPAGTQANEVDRLIDENNQLWESLSVVEQDRVYWVNDEIWTGGRGIIAANLILDDIEKYLVEGADTTGGETS